MGNVTFYVVAHQDDWQLFRGEQAWADLRSGARVVIICVTAGEASPPWQVRELGSLVSCQVAIDGKVMDLSPTIFGVEANGHMVQCSKYKNSTTYFLRIPEAGNSLGGPLQRLHEADERVTTVDGAATYRSWSDLTTTLRELMERERIEAAEPNPWFNTFEFEQPMGGRFDDNPDHILTGQAVQDAGLDAYNKLYFYGYRPPPPWLAPDERNPPDNDGDLQLPDNNLEPDQVEHKKQLFLGYARTHSNFFTDFEQHHSIYEDWLARSFFHVR